MSDTPSSIADVLSLAQVNLEPDAEGYIHCSIAASALYPAMVALIAGTAAPAVKDEQSARHYRQSLTRIRKNTRAIADAGQLTPEVEADPVRRRERAEVLELARRWFTAELHDLVGRPMHLHITVEREPCANCVGAGLVQAGRSAMVACPVCKGKGSVKVQSPWRL